ncbi:MAG: protoporphyrinogen oxidase, partial [Deltaproteobacteria bacterium]|nr:protoporphyrinogen oxidase [Deltaproteobacteria bacterium]
YVVHQGALQPLPEGFFLLAPTRLWPFLRTPLFSWSGKLRMACELFMPRGGADNDESLATFVRRRFGAEALDRVAQPLVGGIYAADPEKLSLAATMPRFLELERKQRSVIWAMWSEQWRRSRSRQRGSGARWSLFGGSGARWSLFVTFSGGMEEFVDAVASRLPEASVRVGTPVTGLERNATQGTWTLHAGGESFEAAAVILAAPAYRSAEIVASLAAGMAEDLKVIPYASTATVSLAYRKEDFPHAPDSFGFVVPSAESRKIMACTFSSMKYAGRAPEDYVLLRAFVGGALQPSLFEDDDATMENNVRQELASLLGVTAAPLFSRLHRHPRSMPQYQVGHQERVRRIETALSKLPGLALAGSAYHGVGIADCIHSGEEAAERMLLQLKIRTV